jgi:hypothetical protein
MKPGMPFCVLSSGEARILHYSSLFWKIHQDFTRFHNTQGYFSFKLVAKKSGKLQ